MRGLRVAPYKEVYATAQPFEVGTCGRPGECRALEFARRGLRKRCGRLLRPLNATPASQDLTEPQHLARQAAVTRPLPGSCRSTHDPRDWRDRAHA